jgi:hypothetical protein
MWRLAAVSHVLAHGPVAAQLLANPDWAGQLELAWAYQPYDDGLGGVAVRSVKPSLQAPEVVLKMKDVPPRVAAVRSWRTVSDEEALRTLGDPTFIPFESALLAPGNDVCAPPAGDPGPMPEIEIERLIPGRYEFTVKNHGRSCCAWRKSSIRTGKRPWMGDPGRWCGSTTCSKAWPSRSRNAPGGIGLSAVVSACSAAMDGDIGRAGGRRLAGRDRRPERGRGVSGGLFVDVVIPFRRWDAWTAESTRAGAGTEAPVPARHAGAGRVVGSSGLVGHPADAGADRVRELPSGPVNPGRKRNVAMAGNEADVFGFVDADARALPDWLEKGLPHFADEAVAIVGGPNLTPPRTMRGRKPAAT